jgi:hypothetical protein
MLKTTCEVISSCFAHNRLEPSGSTSFPGPFQKTPWERGCFRIGDGVEVRSQIKEKYIRARHMRILPLEVRHVYDTKYFCSGRVIPMKIGQIRAPI